jgi:hypothetical protein
MSCTERYRHNKARVCEIMGISPQDRRFNIHHLIGRKEYHDNPRFWDETAPNHHFDIDGLGNLFPVTLDQHEWINERTESCQLKHLKRRRKWWNKLPTCRSRR